VAYNKRPGTMWEEVHDSEDSEDPKAEFFRQQRVKCDHLKNTVLLRTPKVDKASEH
jgi:hypothetical protein